MCTVHRRMCTVPHSYLLARDVRGQWCRWCEWVNADRASGLEAGFGPAAEHLDLLLRPGAVAGHGAVAQALQDAGRVRLYVAWRPQVEGERHRLAVVLAEQRLDVRREADGLVRGGQRDRRLLLGAGLGGRRRARGTPVPGGRGCVTG